MVEQESLNKSRRCLRVRGGGNLLGLVYSHRVGKGVGKGSREPMIRRGSNHSMQIRLTRRNRTRRESATLYLSTTRSPRNLSLSSTTDRPGPSLPDLQELGHFDLLLRSISSFDVSYRSSASPIHLDLDSTLYSHLSPPKIPRNPHLVNNTSTQPSSASPFPRLLPARSLHLLPPRLHPTHLTSLDKFELLD